MASANVAHHTLRTRAINLLETFFRPLHNASARRAVFDQAFDGCNPNPADKDIDFSGAVGDFAAHAVDVLFTRPRARRGKHYLSLLLHEMNPNQTQTHPDYYQLPLLLDAECALPTRGEELEYLNRLVRDIEAKARLFSPLSAIADTHPTRFAANTDPWDEPALSVLLQHRAEKREARDYDDILTAFDDVKHAVLLGAPGSGKSTTLRKLALDLAKRALEDTNAPLPLLVNLGYWLGDQPLIGFMAEQSPEIGWAVEALSKSGRLVLLLDGLNEVPTAKRGAKAAEIRLLFETLAKLNPDGAAVASCRREDYTGELDLGLDTLTLEPLSPPRVRTVLRRWAEALGIPTVRADSLFWQLAGDEHLARVLQECLAAAASEETFWSNPDAQTELPKWLSWQNADLWRHHLSNPRSLLRLASNPFLLTMLFVVWREQGDIPRNRGDLFGKFSKGLLIREGLAVWIEATKEYRVKPDGETLLHGLTELAWKMQRDRIAAGQGESGEFGVLTVVSEEVALQVLTSPFLLKKALDCTILEGTEELRFRHQLLQEYFTAKALLVRLDHGHADYTRPADLWPAARWWERTGWEEAAVLLAGFHSDDCSKIIRWLADAQPEVAAQCILESGASMADQPALLRELQSDWLARLTSLEREPAPEGRAAVGRALGRLGLDNRKGVGLRPDGLPDIDWVTIAGGEFLYQHGERRKMEAFRMARYPVTNAQFQAFLDAGDGYADDRWWKGLDEPNRTSQPPSWSESNHPRETVSWHEAIAFCAWLGYKLRLNVSLPTEWQWERGARGYDGSQFPWGNEYQSGYANIDESYGEAGAHYLARTSPAGIYPHGASGEGVLDLAGNLWEWCLNEYKKPDRIKLGGKESRVLRGGSWDDGLGNARAGYRFSSRPVNRSNGIGFRVVVGSPIWRLKNSSAGH